VKRAYSKEEAELLYPISPFCLRSLLSSVFFCACAKQQNCRFPTTMQ